MPSHSADEQLLRRALELAREGMGLASPNPYVGAVVVDPQGNVAGEGVYSYAGRKHAEVLALQEAGEQSRGGTLYINLEPHAHQGRTPPCTDALIAAGIHRVVASMPDPNPKVAGRGFEKLRAAGVQVEVGRLGTEARRLNEAFARYIRHGEPLVTLKSAMTLDGKIAPSAAAQSKREAGIPAGGWITGESARAHVQQQRRQSDAILTGVGTILTDDPLLTDRSGQPRRRPLLRVILDSKLRLPLESRLVRSSADDVLVFCGAGAAAKQHELKARGIRVEHIAGGAVSAGRPDIHAVLRRLAELEISSVMIEGGAMVYGAALSACAVDKLFLYYAPKLMADDDAIKFASSSADHEMNRAVRLNQVQLHRFGDDVAVEGYLRDPYAD
ncbi:MAG: bifunctional diaminohydroxyphosphoribosylaminopyrimidine deaminase/5-amino-6-(5-phosphoribosylamino)uracil reductase RibD [Candidatus Sulfotelmatobacter sp.]|jgi:diaminohydroxyphosphoribosylaminopyrimidine deaminase/5-amino-6-(5-phosphoribosylamino)uracil reductase